MKLHSLILALSLGFFSACVSRLPPTRLSMPHCVAARGVPSYLKNCRATVIVEAEVGKKTFIGSGVVVARDGFVLVNAHTLLGKGAQDKVPDLITVRYDTCDGQTKETVAGVVRVFPGIDLALLQVPDHFPTEVVLGSDDDLRPGDPVYIIGTPLGVHPHSFIKSYISNWDARDDTIVLGSGVAKGTSGGGVYDQRGRLIGVMYAGLPVLSYAISVRTIRSFLATHPRFKGLK